MGGLGVGLIGTGYMGKCHALAWNAVAPVFGDVERPRLAVLGEATQELAERKAREFGFARGTGDWREVVARPRRRRRLDHDARTRSIRTMAIAALEAGKHVWCEKPMAGSLADAERMLAAARAAGRVTVLGYNFIQNPTIVLMRRILEEGQIGDGQPRPHRDGRGFHGRPGGAVLLEERGRLPATARSTISACTRSACSRSCSAACAGSAATWRSPTPTGLSPAGGRRAVETYDIATIADRTR